MTPDWRTLLEKLMNTSPLEWQASDLAALSARDLRTLCRLMGVPYSGTAETLRGRLLTIARLRVALSQFDTIDAMKATFKLKTLQAMCRDAKIWIGGNKRQCSASLLNWRNECRTSGIKYLKIYRWENKRKAQLAFCFDSELKGQKQCT